MRLTKEQSEEQAVTLKQIQKLMLTLDLEYLEECVKQMKDSDSFAMSAMVLNSSPFTAGEQIDLNKLKTKQLEYYVSAAKNLKNIANAELNLMQAKRQTNDLSKLFGI